VRRKREESQNQMLEGKERKEIKGWMVHDDGGMQPGFSTRWARI
jgi:hypothetical protein